MTSGQPERADAEKKEQHARANATRGPGSGDTSLVPGASKPGVPFEKLPAEFGRYRVEKILGSGAMGAVYLARDSQLDRPVALKSMTRRCAKSASASSSPPGRRRTIRGGSQRTPTRRRS